MTALYQPIYTTFDSVKIRLANKVQFQSSPELLDGELPDILLSQLIVDAETKVEQDLRSRYSIPFQSKRTGQYCDLPDHSKRALRVAVDYMCVVHILQTDFGRGTHVNAEDYMSNLQKEYSTYIMRLLGRDQIGENEKIDRFKVSPPLDDVLLAPTNKEADDGYRGMIINTDASHLDPVSYALDEINNPARSYTRTRGLGGL